MPGATTAQLDDFTKIQLASVSPETAVRLRRAVDRFNVTGYLSKVQAPTLVIHAQEDAIHPIEQGRIIAGGIPDARFIALDSANHVPLPQDPSWQLMVQSATDFLDEFMN